MMRLFIFLFLFTLSAMAEQKILFIGNSYTGGIRKTVSELFKNEKADVKIEYINPGGKNLKFHFENKKTIDKVKSGNWDYIVLQDQSQTPALPGQYSAMFHKAADDFGKLCKSLKKKPEICFYMTWGRRDGDKRNKHLFPDFTTMQAKLTKSYSDAAKRLKSKIAPVGLGFKNIHDSDKELFKSLYVKDGSHPSKTGAYLAACIFYKTLMNKSLESVKWNGNLDAKVAAKLRKVAKEVTK